MNDAVPRAGLTTKLKNLAWSRRSYALVYALAVWFVHESLGMTEEEAAEIVGAVLAWVISDSIKPTGGEATEGPPLAVWSLAESVRFWLLVASQTATLLLPQSMSLPITAACSTLIVGRALRKPA